MSARRFALAVAAVLLVFMIGFMAGSSDLKIKIGDWPFGQSTVLSSAGALVLVLFGVAVGVRARSTQEFVANLKALSRNEVKSRVFVTGLASTRSFPRGHGV